MPHFICATCGTQYADSDTPPASCAICQDDRQYVRKTGQNWTTPDFLPLTHRCSLRYREPGLIGIGIDPPFAIGQRALFLRTPVGNVLWDCIPLLDRAIVEMIEAMGGLDAIAISHPHYYSGMVEWSRAFGGVPIHLHVDDRQWVMRSGEAIHFWEGETKPLLEGMTLIRCGGHFPGGTVLHWKEGAEGKGVLLSGDVIQVVPDRRHVSFMYSYPNYIPLSAAQVQRIAQAVEPFDFERIYGAFWDLVIEQDARAVVTRSVDRYLSAIGHLSSSSSSHDDQPIQDGFSQYLKSAYDLALEAERDGSDAGHLKMVCDLCRKGVRANHDTLDSRRFLQEYLWCVGSIQKDFDTREGYWESQLELFRQCDAARIAAEENVIRAEWEESKCYMNGRMVEAVIGTAKQIDAEGWEAFKRDNLLLPDDSEAETAEAWTDAYWKLDALPMVGDAIAWYLIRNLYGGPFFKPDVHILAIANHFFGEADDPVATLADAVKKEWANIMLDQRFLPVHLGEIDFILWWYRRSTGEPE